MVHNRAWLPGVDILHGELMIRRDIVVIGASTGGVEALKALIAELWVFWSIVTGHSGIVTGHSD